MNKKEFVRELIEFARKEGASIEFDNQFGHDGFVAADGEFYCTDGFTIGYICKLIGENAD